MFAPWADWVANRAALRPSVHPPPSPDSVHVPSLEQDKSHGQVIQHIKLGYIAWFLGESGSTEPQVYFFA